MNLEGVFDLDEFQKRAAYSLAQNIFISAPAGSGKTRVLIERVSWLVKSHKVKPESILVLTFAKVAAKELRERFAKQGLGAIQAKTFHAWSYQLLKSLHALPFRLIHEEQQAKVLRQILIQKLTSPQAGTIKKIAQEKNWSLTFLARQLIYVINTLRYFNLTIKKVRQSYAEKQFTWPFTPLTLEIWQEYEKLLKNNGAYDFNLLISEGKKTLKENKFKRRQIQSSLQHVLVDEVQDANQEELDLINAFVTHKTHKTWVGDCNQAIYAWRGSTPFTTKAKILPLRFNYRSDALIIETVNNFLKTKNILPTKKSIHKPIIIEHARYQESIVIKRILKELHEKNYKARDIMILSRANNPLYRIWDLKKDYKGLQLRTVHGAKGLEAPVVILLNCNEDRFGFPLSECTNQLDIIEKLVKYNQQQEERNIFYVAMTRARERLIILTCSGRPAPYLKSFSRRATKRVKALKLGGRERI